MKILIAANAAVITVDCVSTAPPGSGLTDERTLAFAFDNNESHSARLIQSREGATLVRSNHKFELKQQRYASGFVYSNGPRTLRSKVNELTVDIGRMMPIHYKAL